MLVFVVDVSDDLLIDFRLHGHLPPFTAAAPVPRNAVCSELSERSRMTMAELDTKDREKLDKRQFAYVDSQGEGHLPLSDESHVRNVMARWNQTEFESARAKEAAR